MTETVTNALLPTSPGAGRTVHTFGGRDEHGHEAASHGTIARRVAGLLRLPFGGPCEKRPGPVSYLVPRDTLCGEEIKAGLVIASEDDLYGGWVPHAWMATKAIAHPLVSPSAERPAGWSQAFAGEAAPLTLRGFTAFSTRDALEAGHRLLRSGPVRVKAADADGGRGQIVIGTDAELEHALAAPRARGGLADVMIVEEHLREAITFSVGTARLPDAHMISYCGVQNLTRDGRGRTAYGGSDLLVVPGGFDALLARALPPRLHLAIAQAVAFDALADRHLPGLIASRRNYDVVCGIAADGSARMGVLEQSWRIGGATGAEVAALEVFAREPAVKVVHARTVEIYGDEMPPPDAIVCFRGRDPVLGPMTKYACVEQKLED